MKKIFSNPYHLHSIHEIRSNPSIVPKSNGVYAWFFKQAPPCVPYFDCITHDGLKLLYIGISPDKKAKPNSTQSLKHRIHYHCTGNAEGSTLRRTLGVLLTLESGFPLRRVGSGKRMTFTKKGEQWLNLWMQDNAFVTWTEHDEPWVLEDELLHVLSLPLNIKGNRHHPFASELTKMRKQAIAKARETPIFIETEPESREL